MTSWFPVQELTDGERVVLSELVVEQWESCTDSKDKFSHDTG